MQNTLAGLADQANRCHQQVQRALNDAVSYAKQAGDALRKAKDQSGHGNFGSWLEANFQGAPETANGYMRISEHWEKLQVIPELSVNKALAFLSKHLRPAKTATGISGLAEESADWLRMRMRWVWTDFEADDLSLCLEETENFVAQSRARRQARQASDTTIIFYSGDANISSTPEAVLKEEASVMPTFYSLFRHDPDASARWQRLRNARRCFLDSGAFGIQKDATAEGFYDSPDFFAYMDRYADFIRRNSEFIDLYANVDAIGDAELTLRNQKYLEQRHGLRPVPVVHYGTDLEWLQRYLDEGHELIGLGNLVGNATKPECQAWLDRCFETVNSGAKVHGFGVTSFDALRRYPWYSVDSTAWTKQAGMGIIYVPEKQGGEFDLGVAANQISVTPDTQDRANHFDKLRPDRQQEVLEWLELIGVLYGSNRVPRKVGVSTSDTPRRIANLLYFEQLKQTLPYPRLIAPMGV